MSSQEPMATADQKALLSEDGTPHVNASKFHPLDIVLALLRHKLWLLLGPIVAVAIALVFLSFQEPRYSAIARLLPPKTKPNTATMLNQTGSLAGAGVGGVLEGQKPVNDMYLAILQSRAAADFIESNFELRKRWNTASMEQVYGRLFGMVKITPSPNGIINIEVEDSDPVWAAKIANRYADALQAITQELAVNDASKRRLFYEQQMHVSLQQLTAAEMALRKIQQETGVLKLDNQIQMAIQESGRLRAEIAAKETEMSAMKAFATEQNSDYLRLKFEVEALKKQLAQWRQPIQTTPDISLQASEGLLPEISMEYIKKFREVKNLELVYELFLKELQLTRIDQVKDATMIELLDRAIPSSTASYPRKRRAVSLAALVGFLVSVFGVLVYELISIQLRDEENMRRVRMIGDALRWKKPAMPSRMNFKFKWKKK